jgi:2,4-dienoyl-CoA reductase-like NADH-dependent reductase (Old Yellow Enzyme family)
MVTGGIKEAAFADELVRQGKTDLVGIGTALFTDPDWALKAVKQLRRHQT